MESTGKYCIGAWKKRYVDGIKLNNEYKKFMSNLKKAINLSKEDKFDEIEEHDIPIFKTILLRILAIYFR